MKLKLTTFSTNDTTTMMPMFCYLIQDDNASNYNTQ